MNRVLIFFLATVLSTPVFAHPGTSTLICKSAHSAGLKQSIEVLIKRANGVGWGTPTIKLKINGKLTTLTTPDDLSNYGETFHNSPLKVIRVTAIVEQSEGSNYGAFSILAIPQSVKAFDKTGMPVKWSLKAENDECYDVHGKATFKGIIRGFIQNSDSQTQIDAQVMECSLIYNPGMSC